MIGVRTAIDPRQVRLGATVVLDKLPPHDIAAEEAVVAACLVDNDAIYKIAPVIGPDDFFREKNGWVFEAIRTLWDRNEAINQITVAHELARRERLEPIGGSAYLAQLVADLPTVVGIEYYAQIVARDSVYRKLIQASGMIAQKAYEGGSDLESVLGWAETQLMALRTGEALRDFQHIRTLLEKYLEEAGLESESDAAGPQVLRTGFIDLDTLLGGLKRSDLVILAARPSMGKCLAATSTLILADGSLATIEEVCRRRAAEVVTLGENWKLRRAPAHDFINTGVRPVVRVTTRLGRQINCTPTHPFLTVGGWKPLCELRPADHIAVPRRLHVFGTRDLPEHEAKLLGYLLGDGGLTGSTPKFTNANPRIREDFEQAVVRFGGLTIRVEAHGRSAPTLCVAADTEVVRALRADVAARLRDAMADQGMTAAAAASAAGVYRYAVSNWLNGRATPSTDRLKTLGAALGVQPETWYAADLDDGRKHAKNRLTRWLESLGLWGKGSHDKFVPDIVFQAPRASIAVFLNRLFATDGWATVLASGQVQLGYATVSERMARQVQHLLLRFGVIASLRPRSVKYKDERRQAWQLDITDAESIRAFAAEIGIHGKEEAMARALKALSGKWYRTNTDLIPAEVWRKIDRARGWRSWPDVARAMGHTGVGVNLHVGTRALSRQRLSRIAEALDDAELRLLAESDVYWDRIESIEPLGEQHVYDLTVLDTHNFVANDIIVHNSALGMAFARNAAVAQKAKVAVFSLEMSADQLAQRLLASEANVDSTRLRLGEHTEAEERRIMHAMGVLAACDIFIDDTAVLSVGEMKGKVMRLQREHGLDLVVIDYLQLMQGNGGRNENRVQEISLISRTLKMLARELNVPVVALAQLSRAVESRTPHIPMLSDLRDSGSIEQDADVVMFIYREDYYTKKEEWETQNPDRPSRGFPAGIAQVIVAKHRNGPVGNVDLRFVQKTAKFEDLMVRDDEPPL